MKFLLTIVLCTICLHYSSLSQPNQKIQCDNDCVHEKLPFLFCDYSTGRTVTKCSANPNNEPGFRPLKKRMPPTCYVYDASNFTILPPGYHIGQIDGTDTTLIFAPDWVDGAVSSAAFDWWLASGCPSPQTEGTDDCCLKVMWAKDRFELIGYENNPIGALAVMVHRYKPHTGFPDCRVDCNETRIILNQTSEFMSVGPNGIPQRFFYNGAEPEDNGSLESGDDWEYYHFRSVLLHETGHWYGIGHMGERDDFGVACGEDNYCMMGTGLFPGDERSLTRCPDDLCAFRKLYCCAQTSVDVEEANNEITPRNFSVYPNPLHSGQLFVSLSETLSMYTKKLELIDLQGTVVLKTTIPAGSTIYTVPTGNLAAGVYLVKISTSVLKGSISRKVVIH